jgi:hypothetical protein
MRRRHAIAAAGAILLGTGAVLAVTGGNVDVPLLSSESSYDIALSGPLWTDRTLRDAEGNPDVALVSGGEPLTAQVTGRDGARVESVALEIDGREAARTRMGCAPSCPTHARVSFVPVLPVAPQRTAYDVRVVAYGPGARSASARFEVSVTDDRLPVIEAESTTTAGARAPSQTMLRPAARRIALAVVARARRTGTLPAVPLQLILAGELREGSERVGATLLYAVSPPQANVTATVPAYAVLAPGQSRTPQRVVFTARTLRDLLVDVDTRQQRIISISPGPRSHTTAWTSSTGPTPTGAEDED